MPKGKTYTYEELDRLYKEKQEELETLEGTHEVLEKKFKKTEKELKQWKSEFPDLSADEVVEQLNDTEKAKKNLEKKLKKVNGELEELREELEEAQNNSSHRSPNSESKALKKELEEWKVSFPKQSPEEVVEELNEVRKSKNKLEKELTKTEEKLEELKNTPQQHQSVAIDNQSLELYQDKIVKLNEEIKELKSKVQELERQLEVKDREVFNLTNKKNEKTTVGDEINRVHGYWTNAVETGVAEGNKVMPVIGSAVGGLLGAGAGLVGVGTHTAWLAADGGKEIFEESLGVGADLAKQTGDNLTDVTKKISSDVTKVSEDVVKEGAGILKSGMGMFDNAREGLKVLVTDTMNTGADVYKDSLHTSVDAIENFRKGGENLAGKAMDNTTSVINESIDVAKKTVEGGIGVQYGEFKAGVGLGKDAAVAKELEMSKARVVELEKRVKELEKMLEVQQASQQQNQTLLFDKALNAVVEVAAKSAVNSRAPSRAGTPPPYSKE